MVMARGCPHTQIHCSAYEQGSEVPGAGQPPEICPGPCLTLLFTNYDSFKSAGSSDNKGHDDTSKLYLPDS